LLIHKQLKQKADVQEEQAADYEEIDVSSIRNRQARSIGSEYVALMMLKKNRFRRAFKRSLL